MKKFTTLLYLIISSFFIQAQITLTLADMPSAGDSQSTVYVNDFSNVSVGTAGPNQTYDFSGLSGTDTSYSNFILPVGTPGATIFTNADLAIESDGDYTYIDVTSSDLNFLGATIDTASAGPPSYFSLVFNPSQKVFEIPSTYGTNFTDESGFSLTADGSQVGFDSIRISNYIVRDIEYDGYGTIITPLGSFDGLREQVISTSYDTTEVLFFGIWQVVNTMSNTDTSYNWYSQASKGPLVSVSILNGEVIDASYQLLGATVVAPIANFSFSDQGGGTIAFTDQSSNIPTSWLWDFGDGNTSTQQNPQHTYAAAGTYTVCLTVSNSAGMNTVCQSVTVSFAPVAVFTFTDQGGGTIAFTDESLNQPSGWLWDFGDGNTSTQQNPTHTYATAGTYTVCLTVTNGLGSNTVCQDVTIVFAPIAAFSYTNNIGGGLANFTDESTNSPTEWLWDFGDGNTSTQQMPFHTYAAPGTYTVCLTVTNSAGTDMSCQEIIMIFAPVAAFTFTNQGEGMVDFTDQSTNQPESWFWDFGDGNTSTMQNPQHTFASTGMYTVCLTVSNSIGDDESCQTVDVMVTGIDDLSDQFKVILYPNPVNSELHLSIESNESQILQFKIFNALGQLVVEKAVNSSGQYSFQVANFASGVYHYLLINNEGKQAGNGKFIKE
jgi:PKD repeat protein